MPCARSCDAPTLLAVDVSRLFRSAVMLLGATTLAVSAACTSDDTTPDVEEEEEPQLRIDGPAQVDESLFEGGPAASLGSESGG